MPKKNKMSLGEILIMSMVVIVSFGIAAFFIFPSVLEKMGKDITSTEKYAARMSALIKDTPDCTQYKDRLKELGSSAQSMNGGFTYRVVEVSNDANKAGCKN